MIEITITTRSPNKAIKYLNKLKINIYNIKYNKGSITLLISQKDLNKVSKFYNYKINKIYGKQEILNYTKQNKISIIYLTIFLILISTFTRIIIDIDVISENKNLTSLILNELDKNNIHKYSIVKDNNALAEIKKLILNNNKDTLEWLNIERKGMKYIINLEPKVEKNKTTEPPYCNIIATKNATITRIITHKGVELLSVNDSTKKGDILISGDIKYNEELKKQVCASGIVYGTTWYTINIEIPLNHETITKLDKERYNILIEYNNKKNKLFKSRITNYIDENKKIINIFGIEIYLQKEIEVTKQTIPYTEEELSILIDEKVNNTMSHTLNGESQILDRKVLKKQVNNSTIELELFIVAEEQISTISSD